MTRDVEIRGLYGKMQGGMERFQHKGALGGALGETDAESDGKEQKQSKVTSRSHHLGKNQISPLFLSVFSLFVLRKCKYNVQRSHSTKQWRAGELKLLRRGRGGGGESCTERWSSSQTSEPQSSVCGFSVCC